MIQFYTDFNSYEQFQLFLNVLGSAVYELKHNCRLLTPVNQLFLTPFKLKQLKGYVKLDLIFGIS